MLARVNADNKHDPSFVPPVEGSVGAIVLQPDEKALIAGSFMKHGDANPVSIVRLNREGTLDFLLMWEQGQTARHGGSFRRRMEKCGWLGRSPIVTAIAGKAL